MKTILVATDFSAAAQNALRYGLDMARVLQAKLVLLTVFQQPVALFPETTLALTREELITLAKEALDRQLKAVVKTGDPAVELVVAEGAPAAVILQEAMARECGAIVMGMQRGHEVMRTFFGSTVTALYHQTTVPLIVVPEGAAYEPVSRIVLASDIMPETDVHTLDLLEEIALQFLATVYIVRVVSNRFEEVFELKHHTEKHSQLRAALLTQDEVEKSRHITQALNDFIHTHHINMVAMVPHKHTLLEKWFFKSTTRSMLIRSAIPVLVLPEGN